MPVKTFITQFTVTDLGVRYRVFSRKRRARLECSMKIRNVTALVKRIAVEKTLSTIEANAKQPIDFNKIYHSPEGII